MHDKAFFNKRWTWDRNYDLQWDFTKLLKFNFNALNRSVIDELKEVYTQDDIDNRNDLTIADLGQPRDRSELKSYAWDNVKKD